MSTKKPLYMETTAIPPERTCGEVCTVLVQAGATQISTEYAAGLIVGLRWIMQINGVDRVFEMPARVEPVFRIINGRRKSLDRKSYETRDMETARRVAWRQLLRWTQAQLAMVDCGMVEASEVFFPYIQAPNGQTLFQHFKERGMKMLPAPEVQ